MPEPHPPAAPLTARAQALLALGVGAFAWLGLLGGADGVALVAWLALVGPAAGAMAGGYGVRLWPGAAIALGMWGLALVQVELLDRRALLGLGDALLALAGPFLLGLTLGHWRARRGARSPEGTAGCVLLLTLALATAALWGSLGEGALPWAARWPRLGRLLLDASPLVHALESAGLDWTHAQPMIYGSGGVEWVQRAPHGGALAGAVLVVVGSALAFVAQGRRGGRSAARERA